MAVPILALGAHGSGREFECLTSLEEANPAGLETALGEPLAVVSD